MEARQQRMEAALLGRQEQLFWWLAALPGDYRVLPGHDEETTLQFEREHNPYFYGD